jgi:hypothetical protein
MRGHQGHPTCKIRIQKRARNSVLSFISHGRLQLPCQPFELHKYSSSPTTLHHHSLPHSRYLVVAVAATYISLYSSAISVSLIEPPPISAFSSAALWLSARDPSRFQLPYRPRRFQAIPSTITLLHRLPSQDRRQGHSPHNPDPSGRYSEDPPRCSQTACRRQSNTEGEGEESAKWGRLSTS